MRPNNESSSTEVNSKEEKIKRIRDIIFLILVTSLIGWSDQILDIRGKMETFKIYRGDFYFLNSATNSIYKFDRKLNFIAKIGKKGEGPGEIICCLYSFGFLDDKIYLLSANKVFFFSLNGKFIREVKNPLCKIFLKNGKGIEYSGKNTGKEIIFKVILINRQKNMQKELFSQRYRITPGYKYEAIEPVFQVKYSRNSRQIYISDPLDGKVLIFSENGKRKGEIKITSPEKIKVDRRFRRAFMEKLMQNPYMKNKEFAKQFLKQLHFSKYFPNFHSIYLDKETDCLYVKTFSRRKDKVLFKKYSEDGKFTEGYFFEDKKINILDAQLFTVFNNNNYYYLYEDENGNYLIHQKRLTDK